MGGVQGQLDVFVGGPGDLAEGLAVDRRDIVEILTLDRGHPLATNEVVVTVAEVDDGAGGVRIGVDHVESSSLCWWCCFCEQINLVPVFTSSSASGRAVSGLAAQTVIRGAPHPCMMKDYAVAFTLTVMMG